jgi:alpha-glucosidase
MSMTPWWKSAVFYQIYPRSYADSNGDGIGDLKGISARLPYLSRLGVQAVWLSPFFKSPMKDFGYDVSDYKDVDPMFGTVSDFKALVEEAHRLGLKVMIDQVLSHTSDQHPWFKESRSSRDNPRADWYVWADAKPDGTPPNNWLSIFGGSAWQWDTGRNQYYMHNFLVSQPDLNFHCPAVQEAILDAVSFWCELGVDGFRLDTANFYFHDAKLRDNPGRGGASGNPAVQDFNPYSWQKHQFDKSQPENLEFLKRLRQCVNQFGEVALLGEIGDDDGLARMMEYTAGHERLHMAYSFDLLGPDRSAPFFHDVFSKAESYGDGWACWAIANHDIVRVATRWKADQTSGALLPLVAAMQLTVKGTPCIYQGDELGLPEGVLQFEDLQDPYGITMWPKFQGRDGCRTPMPWVAAAPDLGFGSQGQKPWLPVQPAHRPLAVDQQEGKAGSTLEQYRALLAWRQQRPELLAGGMTLLPVDDQMLGYIRSGDGHDLLCLLNLSGQTVSVARPSGFESAEDDTPAVFAKPALKANEVSLAPWGAAFLRRSH